MRLMFVGTTMLALACSAQAQTLRRDGNWQMTVELTSAVPTRVGAEIGTTMAPFTTVQCISAKMANDRTRFTPLGGGIGVKPQVSTNSDCKVDYKVAGNKENWAVKCTGANPLTGTGEFTLVDETYAGSLRLVVPGRVRNADGTDAWRDVPITMKYSGKRIGDCTKR